MSFSIDGDESDCQCIYPRSSLVSDRNRVAVTVLNAVIFFTSFVVNAVTLTAMIRTKVTRNFKLMTYLVTSNLAVALFVQPLYAGSVFSENCWLLWATQIVTYFFLNTYCLLVTAVAVDRFCALRLVTRNSVTQNAQRAHVLLTFVLFLAASKTAACVITSFFPLGPFVFTVSAISLDMIVINTAVIFYLFIYKKVDFRARQSTIYCRKATKNVHHKTTNSLTIENFRPRTAAVSQRSRIIRPNRRLLKLTFMIIASLYVSYTPYIVVGIWWTYDNTYHPSRGDGQNFTDWLNNAVYWIFLPVFFNGLLNAMVFALGCRPVKKFIKRTIFCIEMESDSRQASHNCSQKPSTNTLDTMDDKTKL